QGRGRRDGDRRQLDGEPGSEVGDAVVMSLRGPVAEGMLFYGVRVAVADQTVMKLCNFTGGTSPAISSLPIRLFTFHRSTLLSARLRPGRRAADVSAQPAADRERRRSRRGLDR